MALISKSDFLAGKHRKFVRVDIPALGGEVQFATPSAADALRFGRLAKKRKDLGEDSEEGLEVSAELTELVLAQLVDEDGKRFLTRDELSQAMDVLPIDALQPLFEAFMEVARVDLKEPAEGND